MTADIPDPQSDDGQEAAELRTHVVRSLLLRAESIVEDTIAVYAFAGMESIEPDDRARLAGEILRLLAHSVREGVPDPQGAEAADLGHMARELDIEVRTLFNMVYLMERSALDELSVEESFGETSESWPDIARMVRRASFDVCAAFSETREPGSAGIIDPLTTLHTRAVFLAAVEKEIARSEQFGHPFAVILLDIDRLADLNATHGYGAGDRVIERIGILVRNYFRETDWVARSGGDTFAVLLPETPCVHAERLAERLRVMVPERLQLHDYRSDKQFPVTVSVGVLVVESVDHPVQPESLLTAAETAVDRATKAGGNRVERASPIGGLATSEGSATG